MLEPTLKAVLILSYTAEKIILYYSTQNSMPALAARLSLRIAPSASAKRATEGAVGVGSALTAAARW